MYVEGNKHSRHYNISEQKGLRKVRSPKHRYVFFSASKPCKRLYKRMLKYPIEPYPKGDNEKYTLGDYIKPIIINTNN